MSLRSNLRFPFLPGTSKLWCRADRVIAGVNFRLLPPTSKQRCRDAAFPECTDAPMKIRNPVINWMIARVGTWILRAIFATCRIDHRRVKEDGTPYAPSKGDVRYCFCLVSFCTLKSSTCLKNILFLFCSSVNLLGRRHFVAFPA